MRVCTDWLLTPYRAAIHAPTATAVIADLHLGYDQVRRRSGEAVPAGDLDETLAGLRALAGRHAVSRLVIAGDLFEDARAGPPLAVFRHRLRAAGVELTAIVPGNHDRGLGGDVGDLPIQPDGVVLGDWLVVHGDKPLTAFPQRGGRVVHGHVHPCLRWPGGIAAACYLVGAGRIVLPAFSADAAGVNVLRDPTWRDYRCWVIAGEDVLDFGELSELQRALRTAR